MRRVLSVSPRDGYDIEPDHDEGETQSLRRFLRPINPDTAKYLAEWYRMEMRNKKSPSLPKE